MLKVVLFRYQSLSVAGSGSDEQKPDAGSAGGSANVGKKLSVSNFWLVGLSSSRLKWICVSLSCLAWLGRQLGRGYRTFTSGGNICWTKSRSCPGYACIQRVYHLISFCVFVGERSLFCLTQTGVVHFTKKLDFIPSCLYSYSATSADGSASAPVIRTLLASHSNQLLVLQDSRLIWAASLDCTPVQLSTANFQWVPPTCLALGPSPML